LSSFGFEVGPLLANIHLTASRHLGASWQEWAL
jgi:hypothetical protein